MTTRNKRKLAALNKENCEEHPRSNLAQNSNAPRSQEDYITQVSEEIEGGVTKRLSKEFSRTENCILGALARLDDFLMNPLLQGHSGTTPEPSRNALSTSQGTNEDDSQNDPHPEAGLFHSQITQNSGPEDGRDSPFRSSMFFKRRQNNLNDHANMSKSYTMKQKNRRLLCYILHWFSFNRFLFFYQSSHLKISLKLLFFFLLNQMFYFSKAN